MTLQALAAIQRSSGQDEYYEACRQLAESRDRVASLWATIAETLIKEPPAQVRSRRRCDAVPLLRAELARQDAALRTMLIAEGEVAPITEPLPALQSNLEKR